jgi:hypothetical protein
MRCGHETCRCEITDDEDFCSDHCRDQAATAGGITDHDSHTCECGHPACQDPADDGTARTEQDIKEAFE